MQSILRKRYYCDFCKKSGGAAGHIKKHESACTMNPSRVCKLCGYLENEPTDFQALYSKTRELMTRTDLVDQDGFFTAKFVSELRTAAGECPACMLAAIRQCGIVSAVTNDLFNYKNEMKDFWDLYNDAKKSW